jgi:4-hydroxy-tetrahydrodipicolinate synthase
MITPLDEQEQVDCRSVRRLVDHIVEGGVHGILVLGTTGEGPALGERKRAAAIQTAVEAVNCRVPVVVGCMAPGTRLALNYIEMAASLGADAAAVTPPFYYSTDDQHVLETHFRRVADESLLPIVIYNIPQNTHSSLAPETIIALGELGNVIGVKESSGNIEYLQSLLDLRSNGQFKVFQGTEVSMVDSLLMGADGLVPGSANVAPHWLVQLYDAAQTGDRQTALEYQQKAVDFWKGCRSAGWLPFLKAAVSVLGLCSGRAIEPMVSASSHQEEQIRCTLRDLGLLK